MKIYLIPVAIEFKFSGPKKEIETSFILSQS